MAYALGQRHVLQFASGGRYALTVTAEESTNPPLADNQLCFELQYETAIVTEDGTHLKSRLDDPQDSCSYAMNDEGDNCLKPPGEDGHSAPVVAGDMTVCTSEPIQITSSDQWVVLENGKYFLHIYPRIGDASLSPCEDLNGEGPTTVDGTPHTPDAPLRFSYKPPENPPGGNKMGKKKIKVIWKKDV